LVSTFDLAHTAGNRKNRTRGIRRRDAARLADGGAIER
jgi:hypothetical protein